MTDVDLRRAATWALRLARRFVAHGMPVYAGALTYRGLLALVPLTLVFLWLIGVFGLEDSLPRLTEALRRLRPGEGGGASLTGLLSAGAVVGAWAISVGARLLMRALNAAHEAEETRPPALRFAFSLVFLPALAVAIALAALLLVLTSRLVGWASGLVGVGAVVGVLGSWLRVPLALGVLGLAATAVYRFGPSVRPPWRAVAAGAALAVALWASASAGFALALANLLDYGATYGSLGAAVALLFYLHLSALVLLLGAEVSALLGRPPGRPDGTERRSAAAGVSRLRR